MNITYNIHDLLKIEISNACDYALSDFNLRYHYFQDKYPASSAEIRVFIGKFKPELSGCFVLDRKFFIKRNYIYIRDSDKRLSWEAQISGLETGEIRINFSHAAGNYFAFPWMFFPDLIMEMYVLQPIIEWKLSQKGFLILHSGTVCKNGEAVLVAGRGSSHKTDGIMQLLDKGYEYMSDDLVILREDQALSLPLSPELFTFSYKHAGREDLTILDQVRLFGFLRNRKNKILPVTDRGRVKKVFLLFPVTGGAERKRGIGLNTAVEHLFWNRMMESTSYVSYKYIIGSFLRAYEYVFPEISFSAGLPLIKARILEAFVAGDVVCLGLESDNNGRLELE